MKFLLSSRRLHSLVISGLLVGVGVADADQHQHCPLANVANPPPRSDDLSTRYGHLPIHSPWQNHHRLVAMSRELASHCQQTPDGSRYHRQPSADLNQPQQAAINPLQSNELQKLMGRHWEITGDTHLLKQAHWLRITSKLNLHQNGVITSWENTPFYTGSQQDCWPTVVHFKTSEFTESAMQSTFRDLPWGSLN